MTSSAKKLVLIPIVRNATKSALSSTKDKCARKSSVHLRNINTTGRIKRSAASATGGGGGESLMVTMTKSSPSSSSPVQVSNITDIEAVTITKNTKNQHASKSLINNNNNNNKNDNHNASSTSSIQDNDSITITPSAIKQIHHLANQKRPDAPSNLYLRVFVDAGGCSGFEYKFELEFKDNDETPIDLDEDVIIRATLDDGSMPIEVVVDQSSLELISGCTVDFAREMIRSSFVISDNPHSESACGCGSSFAVKNFAVSGT